MKFVSVMIFTTVLFFMAYLRLIFYEEEMLVRLKVIPYPTWKRVEFIIFFHLAFISLWVTIYTFPVT